MSFLIKDGPKRVGKFFKKGHRILNTVTLMDYSFEEIRQSAVIDFDNINRSIIHSKLHDKEEVDGAVQKHSSFDSSLLDPSQQNPVIFPSDFTKDWQAEKLNRKRRIMGFDDEDDYDFDAANRMELEFQHQHQHQQNNDDGFDDDGKEIAPKQTMSEPPTAPEQNNQAPMTQMGKLDYMTKALKEIMDSDETPSEENSEFVPLTAQPVSEVKENKEVKEIRDISKMEVAPTPAPQKIVNSEELQKEVEAIRQEARQKGYLDGFKVGEEKGELQVKQTASQLFSKVSELVKDFSGLKSGVLSNIQKNFYELSQAVAESLIQRELSISPEAFSKLMKRAIEETVKSDSFKIRVNPETYEQALKFDPKDLVPHMVKDPEIPVGEFKIESDLTVVDVSVRKVIKDLLDQADLDLFANDPNVKKVG